MFEHQQNKMDELIKDNEDFRRIYNRHQELDKRVTAAELGKFTKLGQIECSRRLPELEGITVRRGATKRCSMNGTNMKTWWPILPEAK